MTELIGILIVLVGCGIGYELQEIKKALRKIAERAK